jgi:hypothetical protein
MCQHVYKNMGNKVCPLCSQPTREVDWKFQNELHKEWIASGKEVQQGWSSI